MVKAVIFDFFGVLALRGAASFRKVHLADDPDKNAQAEQLSDELGRGNIGYNDFVDGLARLGGVSREKVLEYTEDYRPNTELLNYIRGSLKPSYKIGIISNAGEDWVLKILGADNLKLFDDIVLSYKVSSIKPEPEIYGLSANNLGVKAPECVFIDDIERYCQGAEQIGMNSIWYKDFKGFKTELEKILAAGSDN
ncbi:MAG TPA: HAD-IA family hydrolase [Candidatus Saccharimonadales bacterium]|nr:HAD-IA family hydrolase [Candidatus Saccharimonadales bacterium]